MHLLVALSPFSFSTAGLPPVHVYNSSAFSLCSNLTTHINAKYTLLSPRNMLESFLGPNIRVFPRKKNNSCYFVNREFWRGWGGCTCFWFVCSSFAHNNIAAAPQSSCDVSHICHIMLSSTLVSMTKSNSLPLRNTTTSLKCSRKAQKNLVNQDFTSAALIAPAGRCAILHHHTITNFGTTFTFEPPLFPCI